MMPFLSLHVYTTACKLGVARFPIIHAAVLFYLNLSDVERHSLAEVDPGVNSFGVYLI